MSALRPGAIVQYRKVGRVELVEQQRSAAEGDLWESWSVRFVTGPKRYREAGLWDGCYVHPDNVIE